MGRWGSTTQGLLYFGHIRTGEEGVGLDERERRYSVCGLAIERGLSSAMSITKLDPPSLNGAAPTEHGVFAPLDTKASAEELLEHINCIPDVSAGPLVKSSSLRLQP